MLSPRSIGAMAAILCGLTYLSGFALLFTDLMDLGYGTAAADAEAITAYVVENSGMMRVWIILIYAVNGFALAALVLVLGLHFRRLSVLLAEAVRAFGLIWAALVIAAGTVALVGQEGVVALYANEPEQAVSLWRTLYLVETGLGGGTEIAGGAWALLVAFGAFHHRVGSRGFAALGLVVGVCGLLTVFPTLADLTGVIFGLGYILWFFWCALVIMRAGQFELKQTFATVGV